MTVEFGILGPLVAWTGVDDLPLGGLKQRSVLAVLLLKANEFVPTTTLVDELWGGQPPPSAVKAVQNYISRLRRTLGMSVLQTRGTGYVLKVEKSALDADRFEALLDQGRELVAGNIAEEAQRLLREALGLWRGPALVDLRNEPFAQNEIGRLEELRLVALELRLEADLALGRGAEVAGELEALVREHPLRESLRRLLMLALYRIGRQAHALAVYRETRTLLVDELGLEPSQAMQRLEKQILRQDPSLDPAATVPSLSLVGQDRPAGPAPRRFEATTETRKTVTVFSGNLAALTELGAQLDPEASRLAGASLLELASAAASRYGGTAEASAAGGVTACFGLHTAREDDALRAVHAAVEVRDALPARGLKAGIGVSTGEVVIAPQERAPGHVSGPPVALGQRLGAAAAPGEVLIAATTLALVRDAVEAEPVDPVSVSGGADPVLAYRVLQVREVPRRAHRMPFVGRQRELELIGQILEAAWVDRRCELLTIVGPPGVGKSRIASELLAPGRARVVRGRCLPYGEGITYSPVIEVVEQLGLIPANEVAASTIRSLRVETGRVMPPDEIAWAFRNTLEEAAAKRPVVVVFEDIHWGTKPFLDLIEHCALLSVDAPIVLLCTARPELLGRRPAWPMTLRLGPLRNADVEKLIPATISETLRTKLIDAAGGNPLFIEEMLAIADETVGELVVPPTLHALLAARLDWLEPTELSVLERGAVEGAVFHLGSVQALTSSQVQVTAPLAALVRKELIHPVRSELANEHAFRFRDLLIRDEAYDRLSKASRADLHVRHAGWLETHGAGLSSLDERLGYHLEQSHRYRDELGLPHEPGLAARARRHLTAAGNRALLRLDYDAAVSMLDRADALVPPDEVDVALATDLAGALFDAGRGGEALGRARALVVRAAGVGDRVGELCARIQEGVLLRLFEPEGATERLAALVQEALPMVQAAGDDPALYTTYLALGEVEHDRARYDAQLAAYERAVAHARHAELPHELVERRASARWLGSTSVSQLLAWLDEQETQDGWGILGGYRAVALAMLGRFDEARAILAETLAGLNDRRGGVALAFLRTHLATSVELLAGDPAAAVSFGEEGCKLFENMGEKANQSTAAALLAQALCRAGRFDEAIAWADRAAELAAGGNVLTRVLSLVATAKVLGLRGEFAASERHGREAIAVAEQTDFLSGHGDALVTLAEVLEISGRTKEAIPLLEQALGLYERKGHLTMAERVRGRLVAVGALTPDRSPIPKA